MLNVRLRFNHCGIVTEVIGRIVSSWFSDCVVSLQEYIMFIDVLNSFFSTYVNINLIEMLNIPRDKLNTVSSFTTVVFWTVFQWRPDGYGHLQEIAHISK